MVALCRGGDAFWFRSAARRLFDELWSAYQAARDQSRLAKNIARIDELWCEGLDRFGGPFLAGESFSAVDAFYAPVVFRMQTYGLTLSKKAHDYADMMLEFPAMKSWYEQALQEVWRDVPHDEMCLELGDVVEDYRA